MFFWRAIRDNCGYVLTNVRSLSIVGVALGTATFCNLTRSEPSPPSFHQDKSVAANRNAGDSKGDGNTLPQVTIEGQRKKIEHQAYEFVRKVTHNPRFQDDSVPRWNAPLCFAVAGLPTNQGLFALGRLSEIARAAGASVARPGCKYNFFVVFAATPDELLKKAFHLHPKAFDRCDGLQEIKEFLAPSKPQAVRVWHNVRPFRRDGMPIALPIRCGDGTSDNRDIPISLQYFPSRIERYDVIAFSLALVVVDTAYPKSVKLGQLVDYAAMVGLADIASGADLGDVPSILRIFDQSPDQQPSGLTQWDEAFLSALYRSDQASQTQRSQIAVKMSHGILP